MTKRYFYVVQDKVKDTDVQLEGPFPSLEKAKKDCEVDFELEYDYIFTILVQEGTVFSQVCQVVCKKENNEFPWK